jgi:hypothetical protein
MKFRLRGSTFSRNMDREAERMKDYEEYLKTVKKVIPSTQDADAIAARKAELKQASAQLRAEIAAVERDTIPLSTLHTTYQTMLARQSKLENEPFIKNSPSLSESVRATHSVIAEDARARLAALNDRSFAPSGGASSNLS